MHRLRRSFQPAPRETPSVTRTPDAILYLGPESRRLTNVLLVNSRVPVWALDPGERPFAPHLQTSASNRLLGRRYGALQRARDADTIGLAVGTLGVSGYLPLLRQLRQTVAKHRRKCYTVAVGKLRPEKLANLTEVQAWVLVACPENSLLDGLDAKEYPVPVITPFELQIALASADEDAVGPAPKWDGSYVTDFAALLASSQSQGEPPAAQALASSGAWETVPSFSSSTGKLIGRRVWVAHADQPGAGAPAQPSSALVSLMVLRRSGPQSGCT